jgi:DNA repair exonuclease SbcCD ATPase subunit
VDNYFVSEWTATTSEGEINDGFAMPTTIDQREAETVAGEFTKIISGMEDYKTKLQSSLSLTETELSNLTSRALEEHNAVLGEFDEKIAAISHNIENLMAESEAALSKELDSDRQKESEQLNKERDGLKTELDSVTSELQILEKKYKDYVSRIAEIKEEVSKQENRLKRLKETKARIESGKEPFDSLAPTVASYKDAEKGLRERANELVALNGNIARLTVRRSELEIRLGELRLQISGVERREKLLPSKADMDRRKLNEAYAEKRRGLMADLNLLISQRDHRLLEIGAAERKKKSVYEGQLKRLDIITDRLEIGLKKLRGLLWNGGSLLKSNSEILYLPFYLFSRDKKVNVILPPIVLGKRAAVAGASKVQGMAGVLESIEGDWETMSMLLNEARETFDLVNERNQGRVRLGLSQLRQAKVLGRLQEMLFIKEYLAK